jgi:hypothetical protein
VILVTAMLLGLVVSAASAQEAVVLTVTGGDNQTALIGTAYALPLQVTVTSNGAPVAGVMVQFSAPSSGASIVPDIFTATTGANGVASATAAANWYAGAFEALASYGGQTAVFHLTNAGTLAASGGDYQRAAIGMAYAEPLQVKVTDAAGPVAGVMVEFTAPSGAGVASLNPAALTATTDAGGVAGATATAKGYMGYVEVLARYGGQTVTFGLNNTPPLVLAVTGGDLQTAVVGTAYADPLQVTVTNNGAPVAGVTVEFAAPSSGPCLNPATFTAMTDANGIASAAVTANANAGFFEVLASYGGQSTTFLLSNSGTPVLQGVLNTNPDFLASHCEFNDGIAAGDPSVNGNAHVCLSKSTKEDCEKYKYCWWRDTTEQNTISQYTADEYTDRVYQVYDHLNLEVWVYSSNSAANVVLIMTPKKYLLVGAGGGEQEALRARSKFLTSVPGFGIRSMFGIVYPSADPEVSWGGRKWNAPQVYASEDLETAQSRAQLTAAAKAQRDDYVYGRELQWGINGLIGIGAGKLYEPIDAAYRPPTVTIIETTDITMEGRWITLIPTLPEIGGLSVNIPEADLLIPCDLFGPFLPPIAPLNGPYIPIEDVINTLDSYRTLECNQDGTCWGPDKLVFMHGLPVLAAASVDAALLDERDALQYLLDQTLANANELVPLEDIVDTVKLVPPLSESNYTRSLAADQAAIVRAVYHEYLGWFDGEVAHLASRSSMEQARRLIEFGGGENAVLSYIKKRLSEHTREGAIEAVDKLSALRKVYHSTLADAYYIQALTMLGWTTPNAPGRNWYLMEAYQAEMGH